MKSFLTKSIILGCGIGILVLSGCAVTKVKPWEHDRLAQKKMKPSPDPVQKSFDDHIYFSKEASTGGQGVGGGGCGCN